MENYTKNNRILVKLFNSRQGDSSRLHQRVEFFIDSNNEWKIRILSP